MKTLTKLFVSLFVVFALHITLYTLHSHAAVPHLINYQGRLTDSGGAPLNGSYAVTFRIYDAETAGNLLWEETHTGVVINKGIFSIILGSITNLDLPFDKQYFLEIKVGNEVMSPRQRLVSSGYAIRAEKTDEIPKGAILIIKGTTCPAGYRRCAELDGKFLVGDMSYNTAAGGNNAISLSVNNLPSHTHSTPDHSHTIKGSGSGLYGTYFATAVALKSGCVGIACPQTDKAAYITDTNLILGGGGTTDAVGSGEAFDIRPAFATVVLCEKE